MNPATTIIKIRKRDHLRLKRYAKKHGLAQIEVLADVLNKLEVRKLESEELKTKEIDVDVCDSCDAEVPSDAKFCPYCGAEFEDEAESEDDEAEEEE